MFEIKDLKVSIEGKEILKGIDLQIKAGEIHAIMGPNGAGKSSLAEALMGHPSMDVKGSIMLASEEMNGLAADERAKKGMFLAFQSPEEIEGLMVSRFIRKALSSKHGSEPDIDSMMEYHKELLKNAEALGIKESVSRELNVGFSGGEKKRLEVLQMLALKPKMIILDEVDSGLDVDGIKAIAGTISSLNDGSRGFLIITHYPRILKYIKPNQVHILANGRIAFSGDHSLAEKIEESGYSSFLK